MTTPSGGIRELIEDALTSAVRSLGVEVALPDLELGRAKGGDRGERGDYASPAGLKLAKVLREAPPSIAGRLAGVISIPHDAATVEAVGGYVNFRLTADWLRRLVATVAANGPGYGRSQLGGGERLQVEFASINPTGPLHIGHGRGTILGDSICRLLEFTGHDVQREYYVNSDNTQTRRFGASVYARLHGKEPPEGGYTGDYVTEIAEAARRDLPGIEGLPEEEAEPKLRMYAIQKVVERISATVARLNIHYDEWFWESRVWESGLAPRAIDRLRESGYLKERDGALWFGPALEEEDGLGEQVLAEDEDRVVIRSNGQPTYFASDLGYLLSRFEERGYNRVIEVWGADHHGYVPRMKSAVAALGFDPEKLVVILHQMVNLKEGKMSKRAGRFVTLDELVDRVGSDPVRYFYLLRSPDTTIEFDLELAITQSNENPVYYAQYAHARLVNVEVTASERHPRLPDRADMSLLVHPWELDVARQLAFWPEIVQDAARLLEPHRIPYYVQDLATAVHRFYHAGNETSEHRVVVDDIELTRARLELCRAARHTLRTALDLMGVSAPERM
ncbi:MAG: arginine--tRNA ligase [Chloroflexi bacterium]|nr:MAG: arginine--tRNA ligase [Chloroflexota bacterium]TMC71107.1 MAG: arginine--tRNA ligase [Chloroflexota bacterium]